MAILASTGCQLAQPVAERPSSHRRSPCPAPLVHEAASAMHSAPAAPGAEADRSYKEAAGVDGGGGGGGGLGGRLVLA
eukprot:3469508-Alexandrium_andersonii.AAC.1